MKMQRHGVSAALDGSHGIDLAPMLDFVLNLLIFFIITAIFLKEFAIDINRPTSDSAQEAANVRILVLKSGEVFFNDRIVDVRAIRANVERERAANTELGVTVLAG